MSTVGQPMERWQPAVGGGPTEIGGVMKRAQRARRVDPVLLMLGVLMLLVTIGYGLDLGGRTGQVVVCWLLMAAVHLYFAVAAGRVTRLATAPAVTRRLWRGCAVVGSVYLLGDLLQLGAVAVDPTAASSATGTVAQAVCVVVGTLIMLGAMLSSPLGIESSRARSRFWLDVATVMVAAATFGFYGIALPRGEHPAQWLITVAVTVLSGPGVFLVGVFAVVKLILGGRPPFTFAAGIACGAAAALEAVLQASVPTGQSSRELAWVLGGNIVASTLLAAGARIQYLQTPMTLQVRPQGQARPYSVLPYGAIAATYVLLVVVLATQGLTGHAWVVVGGAICSTSLVVGRQLAAFRHIAELLAERDELGAQLAHQAFHDSLTGLPNRALLRERLITALDRADGDVAVVIVDLDDFKPVNDRYGHAAGDALLVQVGAWLTALVRDGDTVARLGGDEFAVLLTEVQGADPVAVAERVGAALNRSLRLDSADVQVRASIGVAFGRSGRDRPDELLHQADLSMYAAKRRGKVSV